MRAIAVAAGLAAASFSPAAGAGALPKGFVYLSEVAPAVRQDMRYAGNRNFTGGTIPGYRAAECVLERDAALALGAVAEALAARGLGLKVFDCYRPVKAVRHFMVWARRGGSKLDPAYYPRVDRSRLVAEGYIARRSGHSTGYVVDLTLTDASGAELDMGTPFDFFDPLAHTASKGIDKSAIRRRRVLVAAMLKGGFVNYSREWWHFSFGDQPANAPAYDVDIVPRGG